MIETSLFPKNKLPVQASVQPTLCQGRTPTGAAHSPGNKVDYLILP